MYHFVFVTYLMLCSVESNNSNTLNIIYAVKNNDIREYGIGEEKKPRYHRLYIVISFYIICVVSVRTESK